MLRVSCSKIYSHEHMRLTQTDELDPSNAVKQGRVGVDVAPEGAEVRDWVEHYCVVDSRHIVWYRLAAPDVCGMTFLCFLPHPIYKMTM